MQVQTMEETARDVVVHRRLFAVAGSIYLIWWFAVELILPNTYNPFLSRLAVVGTIFAILGLSYVSKQIRSCLRVLFIACTWLITIHYYSLFYANHGDPNWIVGSYITVIAINFCLWTSTALLSYSVFVTALSVALVVALPHLRDSVFLPGLVTILIQANLGLKLRRGLLKSLSASNERFQTLFHSTFDGILVHEQGRIANTNESLTELSGYTARELSGMNLLDLIAPEERASVAQRVGAQEVLLYETKAITKSGQLKDVEVRAKNFLYENRPARLVAVQDISDRKKAENERISALTLAENVRIRDEFISIASHEFKTPISVLKLQLQILERDQAKGKSNLETSEGRKEVLDLFQRQTDRLSELVETMLDVSRISAGRFVLEKSDVDLTKLIEDAVNLARKRSGGTITAEVPQNLSIYADQRRLEQVLENLLSNAVKYGDGKPIDIQVHAVREEVLILVKDQGIGIDSEALSRIFERFERAIKARNISGLGLGLYIARQIVQAHGGEITVQSQPGQGSTFTVRLPSGRLSNEAPSPKKIEG